MRKHFLPMFSLVFVFCACQRQDDLKPLVEEGDMTFVSPKNAGNSLSNELAMVALTSDTHISVEEAQELALSTAAQMREVEGILTKSPLQIASVEVVANNERKPYVATKSGETPEQGDVYIINFANNQGYVVTSADSRVPGVLAYNSYGNLGKEIDNPGQAIMFSYMQDYIEQERENFEKNKETLKIQAEEHIFAQLPKEKQKELIEKGYFDEKGKRILSKYTIKKCEEGDIRYEYGKIETVYVKAPLLKTLWGQGGDYNDKVSVVCGNDQAAVGCVATAVGQLMAYHKKPTVFKDREMHWEDMTKIDAGDMFSNIYSLGLTPTAKEDIQHLLARLGDSDLLAMNYGCEKGSGAYDTNALRTLHKMGYSADLIDYSVPTLIDNIKNNQPIYISGSSTKTTYTTGWWLWKKERIKYEDGHAWVIDGYVLKEQDVTRRIELHCPLFSGMLDLKEQVYKSKKEIRLIHHNFGWGENKDELSGKYANDTGWYNLGIFDVKGYKESSNTYKSNSHLNFKNNNRIIINIK